MTMESAFIDDGMTQTGKIARSPGLFPAIEFQYRHALPEEIAQHIAAVKSKPSQETSLDTAFLAKHLVGWNLTLKDGKPADCKNESLVGRLHQTVRIEMYRAIAGLSASALSEQLGN